MKKIIIVFVTIFITTNINAQNQDIAYPHVIPMSPEAAELAKYSDYPVSYYTGTPNTSIPLYEIDVDGFKLPISLNYHASGIRVDQEATWVGLGWSLSVGSRISRTVNSADDFKLDWDRGFTHIFAGYYEAPEIDPNLFNHYGPFGDPNSNCHYLLEGCADYTLLYDPEPDIFFYNLPNMSGKFLLDKSRGPLLFEKSHNLKIEVNIIPHPRQVKFKITDTEGNQYFYEQWEDTTNHSDVGWLNMNTPSSNAVYDSDASSFENWFNIRGDLAGPGQAPPPTLVNSWCVTKIITKNGREIIFTYEEEDQNLPTQESCENYRYAAPYGSSNYSNNIYYYKSKVVNRALRLNRIEGDFGRVEFNCSNRLDIKGTSKKLETISIYNNQNTLIKSFGFNYSYFNDDYSGNIQYENVFKRLKLNGVAEYSVENEPVNDGYAFDYFEGSFPPKNSKNVDYWGFQNGKSYGQNCFIGLIINNDLVLEGIKKDANFDKAIIGTLKKITYPTGGTVEYKYESNKMSSGYFQTHTWEPITNNNSTTVDLPVYNYYSVPPWDEETPSQDIYSFEITAQTTLKITCDLENTNGAKDTDFNYNDISNPLGRLIKNSPTSNTIHTYLCPKVYEPIYNPPHPVDGIGPETSLVELEFTLEPGTYDFYAYTPPKDVQANWRLFFQEDIIIVPGTPPAIMDAGGIRIKEIITDAKTRKFNYPTGNMLVEPVLYYFGSREGIPYHINNCFVQVSESKAPLSTFNNGNFIGYDWVEEYLIDEENNVSKTKYTFFNDTESDLFDDNYPDSPRYINYKNGKTKTIEKYKNNTLVQKEEFTYSSTFSSFVKAFKDKGPNVGNANGNYGPYVARKILGYHYQVEWPLKSNQINTQITDDGESLIMETNYDYNAKNLIQSTSQLIENSIYREEMKYPFDFTDAVSLKMVEKNMIGTPVKKENFKDNEKISTRETKFKVLEIVLEDDSEFDLIVPDIIKTSKGNLNDEERLKFNEYNEKGKPLEIEKVNGRKISYIWGYNNTLPVAKIENLAYSSIPNNLILAIQSANSNSDLLTALSELRSHSALSGAMVTTLTYIPLVGVETMTDPLGYKLTYHYDDFNRLEKVTDMEDKILSENEYYYRTQN